MAVKRTLTKLPDGYGRSVVGGREIITAPTKSAEPNIRGVMTENETRMLQDTLQSAALEGMSEAQYGAAFDANPELRPDPNGWAGDYHVDDLAIQYEETKANMTVEEMDDLVSRPPSEGNSTYDKGNNFLAASIRFGRLRELDSMDPMEQYDVKAKQKLDQMINSIKNKR